MKQLLGYLFVFIGLLIIGYVIYLHTNVGKETRTFSTYSLVTSSWEKYKTQFINKDGRVIDYSNNGVTTSEGQSYALLRAVWVDDKPTFDLVWKFTKNSMSHKSDKLFGWRWGKISGNKYGFASKEDENSAADADSDIALALIFAGRRWNTSSYTDQAKDILADIWDKETTSVQGKRYLTAGDWASNESAITVNPSYFSPYAYRVFAQVDHKHAWNDLIAPGYALLKTSGKNKLDADKGVGLPPDWVSIKKSDGSLEPAKSPLTSNYAYDAIRTPWRVALDYQWNKSKDALSYLKGYYGTLIAYYQQNHKLAATYKHNGTVLDDKEGPAMYATSLGFFLYNDPKLAAQVYQDKILKLYSNNTNSFNSALPYYDQNWLWFGLALYNKYLTPFD